MKKYLTYFIGFLLFFGSFLPFILFAQSNINEVTPVIAPTGTPVIGSYTGNCDPSKDENCYQFLEALPTSAGDLTSVNTSATGTEGKGLGGFITFAFEIGVGIAGILGVVMLTIYGFQYAANDKNIATFEVLKEKITKVILGLLLLLGIFVILNTINPDLLIVEPGIEKVTLDIPEGADISYVLEQAASSGNTTISNIYAPIKGHLRDGGTLRPATESARRQMVNSVPESSLMDLRSAGVTVKSSSGSKVIKSTGQKIVAFDTALKRQGITITVTEAFKPTTYKHYAACQYTGTCIDADIPFNAQKLALLVSEASKAGLVAVWETKNAADYKAAISAGVPKSNILLFKSHITGDHFSLYEYQ